MDTIDVLKSIDKVIWGPVLITLLLGTGLYLTFRCRFIQFRGFFRALYLAFVVRKEEGGSGDINHFQALMTALSATVGTGNIVGVATAITLGGPGALFWMWMTGILGMATKFAEAVLAVKYRIRDEKGNMAGGPMYYITIGLKQKWLGVLFAFFASFAAIGIGNMVQANAIKGALLTLIPPHMYLSNISIGLGIGVLTALVIIGGIKGIGRVAGFLVPIMIVLYVSSGLFIILLNFEKVFPALETIIRHAFTPLSGIGGMTGFTVSQAIRTGVARGIFSNESGLGSAPIAAAAARTREPVAQALVSMTQTFIDTLVVCTITGLLIIMSDSWSNPALQGGSLTRSAFSWGLAGGQYIVAVCVILFAFSTIIGWYYYGERCIFFLLGSRAIPFYKILWVSAVVVGAIAELDFVWTLSDIMNALMAFPNLIALIGLSGIIVKETNDYFKKFS